MNIYEQRLVRYFQLADMTCRYDLRGECSPRTMCAHVCANSRVQGWRQHFDAEGASCSRLVSCDVRS